MKTDSRIMNILFDSKFFFLLFWSNVPFETEENLEWNNKKKVNKMQINLRMKKPFDFGLVS